jgi:hypothetical protein
MTLKGRRNGTMLAGRGGAGKENVGNPTRPFFVSNGSNPQTAAAVITFGR